MPVPHFPEFVSTYRALQVNEIISIDETAIHANLHPLYGYSERGKRLRVPMKTMRASKYSLVVAMSSARIEHLEYVKGSYNVALFSGFIDRTLNAVGVRRNLTFLMDNVSFHKNKVIREKITQRGHTVLFTPPYSPDMNPIENVFSVLKHGIRRDYGKPLALVLWSLRFFQIPEATLTRMVHRSQWTSPDTIPPELFRWLPAM